MTQDKRRCFNLCDHAFLHFADVSHLWVHAAGGAVQKQHPPHGAHTGRAAVGGGSRNAASHRVPHSKLGKHSAARVVPLRLGATAVQVPIG